MYNSLLIDRKSTLAIVHIYSPTAPKECELQIPPTNASCILPLHN